MGIQNPSRYTKEHYIKQMATIVQNYILTGKWPVNEIFVDNFAGGGGASTGIEMAIGRSVDIAVNHDPQAIAMHEANHPYTKHYCESVWDVNPLEACKGKPVGLAWFSPDCKHFSKAKGGQPVDKNIRGLAWIVLKWAALVRPRVIMLENVEEFQTWGPVRAKRDKSTGRCIVKTTLNHTRPKNQEWTRVAKPGEIVSDEYLIKEPDPNRKGQTYQMWRSQLEALGYKIETRELIAADYGAPTKRKRFFMIARCDGQPIVWPEPTHGARESKAVKEGLLKPYVSASEIINWNIPCPSIFDTAKEIKEKYGVDAKRPLAENTMKRIARGLQKFVLDNPEPFIVQVNHSGSDWHYSSNINDPIPTVTAKNGYGIVTPYITQIGQTGFTKDRNKSVEDPLTTVVSKNEHCLITPYLAVNTSNHPGGAANEPMHTITTGGHHAIIAPTLIQYHTETANQEVRGQDIQEPVMTIDGSNRYGLVSAFISKYYDGNYQGCGSRCEEPVHTIRTKDSNAVVTAHIIQLNNNMVGTDMNEPLNTIVAGPGHIGEVRAFLIKYYGQGTGQDINEPLDTVVSKDRFGLVTIHGQDYQIVDIGLRMLEPRELYNGNGFPGDYIIEKDLYGNVITKSDQVKRCGNAVPPPFGFVLVRANLPEKAGVRRPNMRIDDSIPQLSFA